MNIDRRQFLSIYALAGMGIAAQRADASGRSRRDAPLLLEKAVRLQQLDRNALIAELRRRAKEGMKTSLSTGDRSEDSDTITICRMLFAARGKGRFRRPMSGEPRYLGGTNWRLWPLEPIEVVSGVPFYIVRGYRLGGYPEPARSYLDYCLAECDWSPVRYAIKTHAELRFALATFLADKRWKHGLEPDEKQFLTDQI